MKMYLGVLGLLLVGVGCGGGEPAPDPAAVGKCQNLVVAICARVGACNPSAPAESATTCVSAVASNLDCSSASGVSSSYDSCISELGGFDCAVLDNGNTTPASCHGAVLVTK